MQRIKSFMRHWRLEIFAALGAAVVLWQMLLPGYVLTLDMSFGPLASPISFAGLSASSWPLYALFAGLHLVLSGWMVEKVVLLALFFLLFYLPLRFYPFASRHGERYVAALFFAINPFVYERLLAGQWNVLFGYALLLPFVAGLVRLKAAPSRRGGVLVFLWLLLTGMFSLHLLVVGAVLLGIYVLVMARGRASLKALALGAALFALASCYWLVPAALTTGTARLETFTPSQWSAFRTASDARIGLEGNVAALYGFWGEHEPWVERFMLAKDEGAWWLAALAAFALVVLAGIYAGLRRAEYRRASLFLLLGGAAAFIFSVGVASQAFGSINTWLFTHIGFWRGFRDSEKWSGALALIYALFAGLGAGFVLDRAAWRRITLLALCAAPLAYTPTLLFGAAGQLQPVWYPQAWYQADAILKQDPACTVLFLPWHQYYTLMWANNETLVGNVAPRFYHCAVVSGKDILLDDVGTPSGLTPQYYAIDALVTSNNADPGATIAALKGQGIRYIIYTDDLWGADAYAYPFIQSSRLKEILSTQGLVLFKVL